MAKALLIIGVMLIAFSGACSAMIDWPNDFWCFGGWFAGWAMIAACLYLAMAKRQD